MAKKKLTKKQKRQRKKAKKKLKKLKAKLKKLSREASEAFGCPESMLYGRWFSD